MIAVSVFSSSTGWQYLVTGEDVQEIIENLQNDFEFHGDDLSKAYDVFAVADNRQCAFIEAYVQHYINNVQKENEV